MNMNMSTNLIYQSDLEYEENLKNNPLSIHKMKKLFLEYLGMDSETYYISNITTGRITIHNKETSQFSINLFYVPEEDGKILLFIKTEQYIQNKDDAELIENENNAFNLSLKDSLTIFNDFEINLESNIKNITLRDGSNYSNVTNAFSIKAFDFLEKELVRFYLEKYFSIVPNEELLSFITSKKLITPEDGILTFIDESVKNVFINFKNNMNLSDLKEFFTLNYKV